LTYLTRAQDQFGDDRGWQAENLNNLGGLALDWPEAGDPAQFHRRALDLARAAGAQLQVGRALDGLGRRDLKAGNEERGVYYLRQALALFADIGVPEAAAVRKMLDRLAIS
jgi:hypothetical protein